MRKQQKSLLFWILIIMLMVFAMKSFNDTKQGVVKKISYSEFVKAVKDDKIRDVTFQGDDSISGKFVEGFENGVPFELTGSTGDITFNILREKGITPNYKK